MKTFSLAEIKALVNSSAFTSTQEIEYIDSHTVCDELGMSTEWSFGAARIISTLDDLTITYEEGYSVSSLDPDNVKGSTEGMSEVWKIEGFKVVDEDGTELSVSDFWEIFPDSFSNVDYSL